MSKQGKKRTVDQNGWVDLDSGPPAQLKQQQEE